MSPSPQATATSRGRRKSSHRSASIQQPRPLPTQCRHSAPICSNMPHPAQQQGETRDWRLHRHADYQRVYGRSRKQFSSLLTYLSCCAPRTNGLRTAIRGLPARASASPPARCWAKRWSAIASSGACARPSPSISMHCRRRGRGAPSQAHRAHRRMDRAAERSAPHLRKDHRETQSSAPDMAGSPGSRTHRK